jgi:hypothetical protein
MTAKSDILAILRGQKPARVPWNIHSGLLHPGTLEREMRNAGMGIAEKNVSAYLSVAPNVLIEERLTWEGDTKTFRITHRTPVGELRSRKITGPDGSIWIQEYPVKNADDLRVLEFITNDTAYYSNHAAITAAQKHLGEDGIVVCRILRSPLQRLLIEWMGTEGVSFGLADFPDEMDRVLRGMTAADEMALRITAQSPTEIVWSGENITAPITTPKLFARYCAPYYNHCAALMHAHHKWYGVHMDGQLAALRDAIAQTDLDFVEGFTPRPMGDLDLSEALSAWRDKVLWTNFPGSVFYYSDQAVVEYALNLLETGSASGRFILTFSEDFPDSERSLRLVARAVAHFEEQNLHKGAV